MSDSDQPDGGVTQETNINIQQQDSSTSLVVRAIWFVFIGWWASGIWLTVAWFLNLTVVLMPLGIKMINKVPYVVSLKTRDIENEVLDEDGDVAVKSGNKEQYSLIVRGVYFVFVGWWGSGIWMGVAWLLSVFIITLPVAIWMYGKLPLIVSLYRY